VKLNVTRRTKGNVDLKVYTHHESVSIGPHLPLEWERREANRTLSEDLRQKSLQASSVTFSRSDSSW
jgi:hypothetical protein